MNELQKILNDILVEAEAATEEPWKNWRSIDGGGNPLRIICAGEDVDKDRVCKVESFVGEKNKGTQNATFIAHARTTVPRLCEALKVAGMVLAIFKEGDSTAVRICLARITAILKGEKNE